MSNSTTLWSTLLLLTLVVLGAHSVTAAPRLSTSDATNDACNTAAASMTDECTEEQSEVIDQCTSQPDTCTDTDPCIIEALGCGPRDSDNNDDPYRLLRIVFTVLIALGALLLVALAANYIVVKH